MSAMTREDMKTILLFGIHLAKIDGNFDVWEKKVLARFAEAMRLGEDEKTDMVNQEISLSQGLKRLTTPESRALLLKTLCAVSHSDGEAHPTEVDFIQKVIEKLGTQVFVLPQSEWGVYEQEVIDELHEATQPPMT